MTTALITDDCDKSQDLTFQTDPGQVILSVMGIFRQSSCLVVLKSVIFIDLQYRRT